MSAFDPKRTWTLLRRRQELFPSDALEHRYARQNSALTLAFGGNRFGGTECTGAASREIALPADYAQSSSDLFRPNRARPQSDKFFQNLFASPNWRRQQRNTRRPTDSSRTTQQHRTKLKPDHNEPTKSRKHTARTAIAPVQNVPLPRPRPPAWPRTALFCRSGRSRLQ